MARINKDHLISDYLFLFKKNSHWEIIKSAEIKIERIFSLKFLDLNCFSNEQMTLRNLMALIELRLIFNKPIYSELQSRIFGYLPNIEILELSGKLSNFNLDSLINLKKLRLIGEIMDDFNFSLFDNLCNRLEEILIGLDFFLI